MFDFELHVTSILRHAMWERILKRFGHSLLLTAAAGFLFALVAQFLPITPQATRLSQLVLVILPAILSLAVAALAARRPVHAPAALFEFDRRVGSEARASSLLALIRQGRTGYFRDRLLQAVERESVGWKRLYWPSLKTLASIAVGALLVAAVGVLLTIDRPAPEAVPPVRIRVPDDVDVADAPPETDDSAVEAAEPDPTNWIAEALDDLIGARESATEPEVPEGFDPAEVESYTRSLIEELRREGARPLDPEELDRLSSFVDRTPLDLSDALEAVLLEEDPEEILEQLDLIAAYANQQSLLAQTVEEREEEQSADPEQPLTPPSSTAGGEDPLHPVSGFEDAGEETPGLVEAPLPSEVGETGEIFEYITGGVPIEYSAEDGGAPEIQDLTVDYERVQTILTTRALPQDAFETVRRYFELVSSGGGT